MKLCRGGGQDVAHSSELLAKQFDPDQAAADNHKREESRFTKWMRFDIGAFKAFDHVVAEQQRIGQGLECEGVL